MEALVARQAIFDRTLTVIAYELLYRPSPGEGMRDDMLATTHVISGTLFDIGLDKMLNGHRGFVNVPSDLLQDPRLKALPHESLGLEVLETTHPTPQVLTACKELRSEGFLLSLDDYTGQKALEPFLNVVDWVKVDYRIAPGPPPNGLGRRHPTMRPKLLAEKVETEVELEKAMKLGYDYFQGYFLERPKVIAGRRIGASESARLQLLTELAKPDLDLRLLENLIERDPSLCYRLIRFSNSARFAHANMISSVRHCLVQLGELEIRRWIALTVLPELASGRPKELLEMAVVRARMCEKVAVEAGMNTQSSQAFLVGMFSLLEAMLRRPLTELVEEMRFPDTLRNALLGDPGACKLSAVLSTVEGYERANWETVEKAAGELNLKSEQVAEAYLDAVQWAREVQF